MSQHRTSDSSQTIDVRVGLIDQTIDGHRYPPQPAQDQTSQRLSHYSDTSIPLFTLYLQISEKHDRRKYELFKGEIDSILVFCGLFSATVAALVMPSITGLPSLPPSYNLFRLDGNALAFPAAYSLIPDISDIGTYEQNVGLIETSNLLWFFSLLLSIFCAVHALMLLRWAKPRKWVTSQNYSLPERARMCTNFARRIDRAEKTITKLHWIMLFSLLVFVSGLSYYFFHSDFFPFLASLFMTVAYFLYLFFKHLLPYLRHKKWKISWPGFPRAHRTPSTPEKNQEQGSWLDGEVLKQTLDMSGSDDDLEQFLEAIPGFCTSKIVDNPRSSLDVLGMPKLAEALIGFWNRTLSSSRITESVKVRRLVVCVKVIEATDLSIAVPQFLHLLLGDRDGVLQSVEIGRTFRNGSGTTLSRSIIAGIISNAERNDRWFTLAMDEWGISEGVLRDYLAHGDSVLLANLIHITRHFFHSLLQHDSDLTRKSPSILSSLSEFDILNTLPELQRDFCHLWNEVVQQARSSKADDNPFIDILVEIRRLYVDLHGTDIAHGYFGYFSTSTTQDDLFHQLASYPLCMVPDHHPTSTTQTQQAKPVMLSPSSTSGDQ